MISVGDALQELGIDGWVLRGNPTNENEFNSMFFKVTGIAENGTAIQSNSPSDFGVTWSQVSAKIIELQNAEPLKLLRIERDAKLADTDHYGLSDQTMTDAMITYRQALRDITDTYQSLDTVVWPTKP